MNDELLIIIVLLIIGVYFYSQSNQAPLPSIGNKIGQGLYGAVDAVKQGAQQIDSFFKNDVANAFETYGNNVRNNIVHDAYVVDTFFQNDVNNFFVDTIGGGVQDAANQVKSFFEDNANAVANKAAQEANQVQNFFQNTLPGWFNW